MVAHGPEISLPLFVFLFVLGIGAGYVTDRLPGNLLGRWSMPSCDLPLHEDETCECLPFKKVLAQLRQCSLARGLLLLTITLFSLGLITGQFGPAGWNWVRWTLLLTSVAALYLVATVPDHFLETHLWKHVFITHTPRILIWTFGALLLMHLVVETFQLSHWLKEHQVLLLLAACLLGLVPESGPHLIFLTLFTQGLVPFSVLLASSIVQDGHGMLPLLAESRIDFLKVKCINFLVGLGLGLVGYLFGW